MAKPASVRFCSECGHGLLHHSRNGCTEYGCRCRKTYVEVERETR
jgi:hypothetical protein